MAASVLAPRDRISLGNGFDLRLLSALEVLQARRESGELAEDDGERELCADACLVARALERTEDGTPVFSGGQEALAGLTPEEIAALAGRWRAFSRESASGLDGPPEEEAENGPAAPPEQAEGPVPSQVREGPEEEGQAFEPRAPEEAEVRAERHRHPETKAEEKGTGRRADPLSAEGPPEKGTEEPAELAERKPALPEELPEVWSPERRGPEGEASFPLSLRPARPEEIPLAVPGEPAAGQEELRPALRERDGLDWAERADRAFRRDSRRYDGGFYLY